MKKLVHIFTVPQSLKFLRGQPAFMRSHGWETVVITSAGDELESFGRDEGVQVHAVEMPRKITPGQDLLSLAQLTWRLFTLRPALVHAHTPKGGLLGMLAATMAMVPNRIYHMRGLPLLTARGPKRLLLKTTERISCLLAHKVICVSHSLRDVALDERLSWPSRLEVMLEGSGQGVDTRDRFNPARFPDQAGVELRESLGISADDTVIGFVGRLVQDKGVAELLAAWGDVRELFPEAHLLVVGPFEERDPVPADQRAILEDDDRVHLRGYVADPSAEYTAMDLVVLPTYREGFPNVPLEAASMQLPIVTTSIPGCTDAVVDGETGILVPPRDAVALRDAILRYLESTELRAKHGRAARARVERSFERTLIWAAIAETYEEVSFRSLCSRFRGALR